MKWIKWWVSDYQSATCHLTWTEDCAYRRLLEWSILNERPLPLNQARIESIARTSCKREREAVLAVLREFWTKRKDGWHQARADAEIADYNHRRETAKRAARARWDKPRPKPKPKPRPVPVIAPLPEPVPAEPGDGPAWDEFWNAYPRKSGWGRGAQVWASMTPKERTDAMAGLKRQIKSGKLDGGRYCPFPDRWLTERRWLDDPDLPGDAEFMEELA